MSANNGATQTNTGSNNKKEETGFLASLFGSGNSSNPVATNTTTAQLGGRRKNKNKSRKNKNKNKSRKNRSRKNRSRKNKNKNRK